MRPAQPLALTSGDPAGIGLDIALKVWEQHRGEIAPFVMICHEAPLRARADALGLDVPITVLPDIEDAAKLFARALPVLSPSQPLGAPVVPRKPSPQNAAATIASIADAVALIAAGRCSGVVTNPIAKHVLYGAGFDQPGHTEYLGVLAHAHAGHAPWDAGDIRAPVMLLVSDVLKVAPVTIHIPLRTVADALTHPLIVETITTVHLAMAGDFGIEAPRIAVAGLNPHAGEYGTIGREDLDIVAPALAELRARGIDVVGPLPGDTMFHAAARTTYDVAVTMYHDQGLIPVKTLAFDTGVNATLGLPFIRTSPDHGTAFERAGTGAASPTSLLAAIVTAQAMAAQRAKSGCK